MHSLSQTNTDKPQTCRRETEKSKETFQAYQKGRELIKSSSLLTIHLIVIRDNTISFAKNLKNVCKAFLFV